MKKHYALLAISAFGLLLHSCGSDTKVKTDLTTLINADNIEQHIKTLASDEFQGRKPGTEGETKTINYIKEQFQKYNIKPTSGDSYFQEFAISEIKPVLPEDFTVKSKNGNKKFKVKSDFIAKTNHYGKQIDVVDKDIVFVGFGIVAPEYNWDDYAGIDVTDKIVVALYSDPGLYDSSKFEGNNSTAHAYINSKQKEAQKRGAAGFFTIFHDTGPTGMNWPLVEIMATRSTHFVEGTEPSTDDALLFGGMLSIEAAKELLKMSGQPTDYIQTALSPNFQAVNLGLTGSISVTSEYRKFKTNNVIGMIEGSKRPDEFVIYTAHWDHDGIKEVAVDGDSILNGAIDNATGTAMVLETARVFSSMENKPERSLLFFLTSAEEMGLLGAHYYSDNPLFPIHKTVGVINTDAAYATHPMRIAVDVLKGFSEMDTIVSEAAAEVGRVIIPDDAPQIGTFQRSDHYPFVEKGVPSVWAVGVGDPMQGDSTEAMQIIIDYGPDKYHKVTDEYYEGFIMGNIRLDATLNLTIGYKLANTSFWPNWMKKGLQYKALRDSAMSIN